MAKIITPSNNILEKNLIENANQRWNQRYENRLNWGISADQLSYLTDRFGMFCQPVGTWNGVYNFTHEDVSGDSGLPFNIQYATRLEVVTAENTVDADQAMQSFYTMRGPDWYALHRYPFTYSFYVKSNVPGTYPVFAASVDDQLVYSTTITINSSDTWERKNVFIPAAPTYGGNIFSPALGGMRLSIQWDANFVTINTAPLEQWVSNGTLAANQTNFSGAIGNYFEITGFQCYAGHSVKPFAPRYDNEFEELQALRAYFEKSYATERWVDFTTGLGPALSGRDYNPGITKTDPGVNVSTRVDISMISFRVPKHRNGFQGIWNHRGNLQRNVLSLYNGDTNTPVSLAQNTCSTHNLGTYAETGVIQSLPNNWRAAWMADCELDLPNDFVV